MSRPALGLIETKGLAGAIKATHAATKAGEVVIASAVKTKAGYVAVKIEGEWSAVQAAVEAGARAADQEGELVSMHVIPHTDNGVSQILPYGQFVARYGSGKPVSLREKPKPRKIPSEPPPLPSAIPIPAPEPDIQQPKPEIPNQPLAPKPAVPVSPTAGEIRPLAELEALPVVELRKYARTVSGLPIQGRQISIANKQQLLEAIKNVAGAISSGS